MHLYLLRNKKGKALITAPPGAPGAATIAIPSIHKNGNIIENECGIPFNNRTPIIQLVKVIILPDKWIVAHRGTTKSTISGLVPFSIHIEYLLGIVAADDWVPTAVNMLVFGF